MLANGKAIKLAVNDVTIPPLLVYENEIEYKFNALSVTKSFQSPRSWLVEKPSGSIWWEHLVGAFGGSIWGWEHLGMGTFGDTHKVKTGVRLGKMSFRLVVVPKRNRYRLQS